MKKPKTAEESQRTIPGVVNEESAPSGERKPVPNNSPTKEIEERRKRSRKADRQEFFLPVTGFAWFFPEEVAVINHPAFQRLSRINQLGQTNLVFRGASHRRIEHVLGAVHIAQRMIAAVNFNAEKELNKPEAERRAYAPLTEEEQRFIRIGALLHDIGHVAAGHTLEDELSLIGKHDEDERLTLIFEKNDWGIFGGKNQAKLPLRQLLDQEYGIWVPSSLRQEGVTPTEIVRILIRKPPKLDDQFAGQQEILAASSEIRLDACANMIGNTICADLLDYLHRDWYHIGKPNFFDDRIFQYMEIRGSVGSQRSPVASPNDRFVIALGQSPKIRTDGVSAILNLLEWRYQLAETALFHRTKLSAAAMLDRGLFELWEDKSGEELVQQILLYSDEQLLEAAYSHAFQMEARGGDSKIRYSISRKLLEKLTNRNLYTDLVTLEAQRIAPDRREWIQKTFGGDESEGRKSHERAARNRTETVRQLEIDFDLDPGSLAVYCAEIKPKIAQVRISVDSEVDTFHGYEIANEERDRKLLSGGHLKAQVERFKRLWRIHFFIDRDQKSALGITKVKKLQDFILHHILNDDRDGRLKHTVEDIARAVVMTTNEEREGKSDHKLVFTKERPVAARGERDRKRGFVYPNGVPSIRSFILE